MKQLKLPIALVCFLIASTTQAQRLKNTAGYFSKPSKVGLMIVTVADVDLNKSASGFGLVGALAFSGKRKTSKYDSAMDAIEIPANPYSKLDSFFTVILSQNKKEVVHIPAPAGFKRSDLAVEKQDKKSYLKQDLTYLKKEYNVDEILVVVSVYGIHSITSYGVVEQNRSGYVGTLAELVSATDNEIIFREWNYGRSDIKGKWHTPPGYGNIKSAIDRAAVRCIENTAKKFVKMAGS